MECGMHRIIRVDQLWSIYFGLYVYMYDLLSLQHSTHCSLSLSDSAQKHTLSVALAPTCMKPIWPYTTNTSMLHVILATKWSYVINIKNHHMSLASVYIYVSNSYVVFYIPQVVCVYIIISHGIKCT